MSGQWTQTRQAEIRFHGNPGDRWIGSSKERSKDAYVAVDYRRHWFWIDDRDLRSKRGFALMMMIVERKYSASPHKH